MKITVEVKTKKYKKYFKFIADIVCHSNETLDEFYPHCIKVDARPKDILIGRGGHHIWFADKDDPGKRLAIITE